jgi:dipeptidase E
MRCLQGYLAVWPGCGELLSCYRNTMKLFLSSYQIGTATDRLLELLEPNTRVAVIMNAADVYGDEKRPEYAKKYRDQFAELGLQAEELDLRNYFEDNAGLRGALQKCGLLWVTGGNTFSLRDTMRLSGFDTLLPEMLREDALVYGGFSAGACVLSPSLKGIELCDDPGVVADHPGKWDGLGLIDFYIAPHYRSNHPESHMIEDVVRYYQEHEMQYYALRDGEAIVVVDGKAEKVGEPW